MIFNAPSDFLSLHQNIQYYNTHKKDCILDQDLRVLSTKEVENIVADPEIFKRILGKIQKLYTGNPRDDQWLNLIKKDLQKIAASDAKIENSVKEILNQVSALQKTNLGRLEPVDWLKQGIVNVVTCLDHDIADSVGALQYTIYNALCSQDNVLILPKTLFTFGLEARVTRYTQDFEIFTQKDSGFIVLIPKSFLKEGSIDKSLTALGLDPTQLSPTPVSVQEIYKNYRGDNATVEQWDALWLRGNSLSKRWYFTGHGESESKDKALKIAGLSESHFENLIKSIKRQHSDLVAFESCHSGRTLPEVQEKFFSEGKFPVLSWSRIDKPIVAGYTDFHLLWTGIHDYLKNSSHEQRASRSLKPLLNHYLQGLPEFDESKDKDYERQPLILPAHSSSVPQGFKGVESEAATSAFQISPIELRQAQLKSQAHEMDIPSSKTITEVSPNIVEATLILKKTAVALQSMHPKKAMHYIDEIHLSEGKAKDFFDSIYEGYMKYPIITFDVPHGDNGFFIRRLKTPAEELKNICIWLTSEGAFIAYNDEKTGAHQQKSWGRSNIPIDECLLKSIFILMSAFHESSLTTERHANSIGLFDRVFLQLIGDKVKDPQELKQLNSLARSIMLNETPALLTNEIAALPPNLQGFAIRMALTKINETHLYPLLIQKVVFQPEKVKATLTSKVQTILSETKYSSESPLLQPFLDLVLLNPDIEKALEALEICKKFCASKFPDTNDFPAMKKAMLEAMQHSNDPEKIFSEFIPLAIAQGLTEGLNWVLSYLEEHPSINKKASLDCIQQGFSYIIEKQPISPNDAAALSKFIAYWRDKTQGVVKKEIVLLCINNFLESNLIKAFFTASEFKTYPEIRTEMLRDIRKIQSRSASFLFYLDGFFNLTDDEKKGIIKNDFEHYMTCNNLDDLKHLMSSWITKDDEKQILLASQFRSVISAGDIAPFDLEKASKILGLGLNYRDQNFIMDFEYLDNFSPKAMQFIVNNMKDFLDLVVEDSSIAGLDLTENKHVTDCIEYLNYIVKEKGIKLPDDIMDRLLKRLSVFNNTVGGVMGDAVSENWGTIAEWLMAQGCKFKPPQQENQDSFLQQIARLIADGRSPSLIENMLDCRKQSECTNSQKEIYNKILLVAARKGRVDVLEALAAQDCKFSLDVIQRSLFNAPLQFHPKVKGILSKMQASS